MQDEVLCQLFLHLSFEDWKAKVSLLSKAVRHSKAKVKLFSAQVFLIGLGLLSLLSKARTFLYHKIKKKLVVVTLKIGLH
jgi:hypothetical protein